MTRHNTYYIPSFLLTKPVQPKPQIVMQRMQFFTLFTTHDTLATKDSQGPMFNREGQMMSYARSRSEIPDCTPAPHDPTWCEELGISPFSTADAFISEMVLAVKQMRSHRLGTAEPMLRDILSRIQL